MKEGDLRLIASLVDWSDKLMAKVFYETYGKVLQEKFSDYEECKQELKDCVQRNYGNAKVPKTPKRMNPASKLLEQIQQIKIMNFDSDNDDESFIISRPPQPLSRIPPQILQQLQNIELHHSKPGTASCSQHLVNKENAETPKTVNVQNTPNDKQRLGHFQNFYENMETETHDIYDYPALSNDKTPKLRKLKAPITGQPHKSKLLDSVKKEEQIRRLEEKAQQALKHKEEILKDKAERAKRDREERQRRVEENNRMKEMQLQEREKQQRFQEDRLRKFRQEQEDQDKHIRSPAPKTRKMGTPRTQRLNQPSALLKNAVNSVSTTSVNSVQFAASAASNTDLVAACSATTVTLVPENGVRRESGDGFNVIMEDSMKYDTAIKMHTEITNKFHIEEIVDNNFEIHIGDNCENLIENELVAIQDQIEKDNANDADVSLEVLEDQFVDAPGVENVPILPISTSHCLPVCLSTIKSANSGNETEFRPANEAEFMKVSRVQSVNPFNICTPQSIASASKNGQRQVSYEITPDKIHLPSTKDNYVIDDLSSADETDSEEAPRKDIPKWAQKPILMRKITALRQVLTEAQRERHFGRILQPNVNKFFGKYLKEYPVRSSSALWNSPMSDPTPGIDESHLLVKL